MRTNTLNLLSGPMFFATALLWFSLGHGVLGALFVVLALICLQRFVNHR